MFVKAQNDPVLKLKWVQLYLLANRAKKGAKREFFLLWRQRTMETNFHAQCLKIIKKSLIQHCERSELRLHFEWHLSRGVLPETLRRGPYAVVDERCEDTTLDPK